ncbi:MAG: hypothetical protein ACLQBQ_08440 [Smithella sp.]
MNTKRIIYVIVLAASLSLIGCAANKTLRINEEYRQFKAQEYVIPVDNGSVNPLHITLRVANLRMNGKEIPVSSRSLRAKEIRDSLTTFGTAIAHEMSHAHSSALAGQPLQIAVSFDGMEDLHLGSAITKGFLTGFFTIGLVPGVYSYQSKVSVDLLGGKGTYSAESQEVTVKYDINDKNAGGKAGSTARRQADNESLQKIVNKIANQGFFQ